MMKVAGLTRTPPLERIGEPQRRFCGWDDFFSKVRGKWLLEQPEHGPGLGGPVGIEFQKVNGGEGNPYFIVKNNGVHVRHRGEVELIVKNDPPGGHSIDGTHENYLRLSRPGFTMVGIPELTMVRNHGVWDSTEFRLTFPGMTLPTLYFRRAAGLKVYDLP